VLDAEESARVSAAMDPSFIARVRKKLALNQREVVEIFGDGVDAFFGGENDKTMPPVAPVKLLQVLDRHPELLNEIRAG